MSVKRIVAILSALVAAAAVALLVSSCTKPAADSAAGDGHSDHSHTGDDTSTVAETPAGFNADDVSFASMMIPHHEQAVQLSALVPGRSTNPELTALAKQITDAQQPEIDTMKAFLVQWNQGDGNEHSGHGAMDMAGMVDDATMAKLQTLNGAEFDRLWLTSMIGHHRGAIEMAKAELAKGTNADAKTLAQQIITSQQTEIDQMQKMLTGQP